MRTGTILLCVSLLVAELTYAQTPPVAKSMGEVVASTESFKTRDNTELQVLITKPAGVTGRLPAILFVQWLSCDSTVFPPSGGSGWATMLRRIAEESGALLWRTEKRGVGGSEGKCETMDYNTELSDHREALERLRQRPDVDPRRIVVFGASIGGTYAPLVAADQDVAGVIVWGAGATTWAERMLRFERNALELGGVPADTLASEMTLRYRFFERYLIGRETPAQIATADAKLGGVWPRIVGASPAGQYGRPFLFHQQAQQADWARAWSRVRAPVLVLYGNYDWYESAAAAELIVRIVNRNAPGSAQFVQFPGLDHHFMQYDSAEGAYRGTGGRVGADGPVHVMLEWLQQHDLRATK